MGPPIFDIAAIMRAAKSMMAALIAETQTYPVFMSCRTVVIGAHHACWLLLPALFITASVPTVTSTTATRTMTKGLAAVL
jgi:hypothetical protein